MLMSEQYVRRKRLFPLSGCSSTQFPMEFCSRSCQRMPWIALPSKCVKLSQRLFDKPIVQPNLVSLEDLIRLPFARGLCLMCPLLVEAWGRVKYLELASGPTPHHAVNFCVNAKRKHDKRKGKLQASSDCASSLSMFHPRSDVPGAETSRGVGNHINLHMIMFRGIDHDSAFCGSEVMLKNQEKT